MHIPFAIHAGCAASIPAFGLDRILNGQMAVWPI